VIASFDALAASASLLGMSLEQWPLGKCDSNVDREARFRPISDFVNQNDGLISGETISSPVRRA